MTSSKKDHSAETSADLDKPKRRTKSEKTNASEASSSESVRKSKPKKEDAVSDDKTQAPKKRTRTKKTADTAITETSENNTAMHHKNSAEPQDSAEMISTAPAPQKPAARKRSRTENASAESNDKSADPIENDAKAAHIRAPEADAPPHETPAANTLKLSRRKGKLVPAQNADNAPIQPDSSAQKTVLTPNVNLEGLNALKLTRPKGKFIQAKTPNRDAESASDAQSKDAVKPFQAKLISVPWRTCVTAARSIGKLPDSVNALPVPSKSARIRTLTHDQFIEYLNAHDGRILAPIQDRAPVFANALADIDDLHSPMDSDFASTFIHAFNACQTLFFEQIHRNLWYSDTDLTYTFNDNPQPAADTIEPEQENSTDISEEDAALKAVFDLFNIPVQPLNSTETEYSTIRRELIDSHTERIVGVLCDWARSLHWIDRGVIRNEDGKPLYICFLEYAVQILHMDQESASAQDVILADSILHSQFGLDSLDIIILWIMTSLEIDPRFRQCLMSTWDNPASVVYMSTGLIMRFLCQSSAERAHILARLAPSSPLVSMGLIRIVQMGAPTSPLYFELVISEQVIHLLTGTPTLSLASTQYAELEFPQFSEDTFFAQEHNKTFEIIRNFYERPPLNSGTNLEHDNLNMIPSLGFLVEGLPGTGRCTLVKIIASRLKRPIIVVQCSPFSGLHPNDLEIYLQSVFNDAFLLNAILCLRDAGTILTDEKMSSILARQLSKRSTVCAICVDLAVKTLPVIEPYITFKTKMTANLKDSASQFWQSHFNLPFADGSNVNLAELTSQLALQPFQIQKAAKLAYYSTDINSDNRIELTNQSLQKAASAQISKNIGSLAFVTEPEITLDDVVVSDDLMEKIKRIIGSALNRRRVLYEWGLSKRIHRGTGVIALFDGEPGTGKTHSAEAIAKVLGLSLMRVNIATMVDKYIGETEKNLTTIFEQARPDMQLLLFDEADSLFTKRTANVSKSNDRYSNMSVNVLLQLVERYEGVSILTTNLKNALDPAFERRITYKIYFPMPKQPERKRLWEYMCPPDILTSEPIDYEWLSELEMSGGEIKNAVLTAAFTAATNGVLLNSEILYNAGVAEASAAGRVLRRYEEGDDGFN